MSNLKRLEYLDSIRGIAAILVVFHHVFHVYVKSELVQFDFLYNLQEVINLGRVGVIIFFITSGFVIPYSLNKAGKNVVKVFLIKRFFRLYPAYWVSILLAIAVGYGSQINIISTQQVLLNFSMIQGFFGVDSVLGPYWTLHIEWVFYLLCVCLFVLGWLHKSDYLFLGVVAFSILAVFSSMLRYYYSIKIPIMMPLGMAIMLFGSLLRNYLIDQQLELRKKLIVVFIFYIVCLAIATQFYYQEGWMKWFSSHIVAYLFFILLVTKVKLTSAIFVYLGKVSYSLYLLHPLVMSLVFSFFGQFSFSFLGFLCSSVVILFFSVICADVNYRICENKGISLGRKAAKNYI